MDVRSVKKPRAILALAADVEQNASSSVKYRYLIDALENRFHFIQTINAQPENFSKLILTTLTFHVDKKVWRERFHKNFLGFLAASYKVNHSVKQNRRDLEFSLQIGCLFDITWPKKHIPNFIYTDYTSSLSAKNAEAGRSPFAPSELRTWLKREQAAYHSAAHIFVRSNLVKESLTTDYQIDQNKISVVGGGWNFSRPPEEVQRSYSGLINFLFIGKRFYRKGGDILLRAYQKLQQETPKTTLTIVTEEDLPEFDDNENITVLKPVWDRRIIHKLYQDAHVFVLPSRLETWGDVLLEAMAYGIPCIGFNTDALPEIIEDGVTGCVSSRMDEEGLFQAMLGMVRDPRNIKRMGQAARSVSLQKFSWDEVVHRIEKGIYQNLGEI